MGTSIQEMGKMKMLSKEWFDAAFENCEARKEAIEAATHICKAYGIRGQADPAYIANSIERALNPKF